MRKFVFLVLVVAFIAGEASALLVYSANQTFANNELSTETNPFGPFIAGHFDEGTLGGFTPFTATEHTNIFFGVSELQGYRIDNDAGVPGVLVNTDANNSVTTSYGVTYGPLQIHMHPGGIGATGWEEPAHNAILRFIAPTTGIYSILGDWESVHGGATRNMVLHNGATLFVSEADDSNFNLSASLEEGDAVDFVVNRLGWMGEDSTGLRATLTTIPEPTTGLLLALGLAGLGMRRRLH